MALVQCFYSIVQSIAPVIQPIVVPLGAVLGWLCFLGLVWSLWSMVQDSMAKARQLHQIPCAHCQFFTGDYHLKCTVRPQDALSEAAIHCPDYQALRSLMEIPHVDPKTE